jgi:hypothetical protein
MIVLLVYPRVSSWETPQLIAEHQCAHFSPAKASFAVLTQPLKAIVIFYAASPQQAAETFIRGRSIENTPLNLQHTEINIK